ncbi:8027_t:CDS:2 [Gigaspora rosea]|nr:8027_t:CDS:2 [Gigaspora rosea]
MEEHNEEYNEDDFDISTYFEEASCNETVNSTFRNTEPGFKIRLGHVKRVDTAEDESITHKRTILCRHSGTFVPKNNARSSTLARLMCPWHINLSRPLKNNPNFHITVTTFNDEHNHDLSPEAIQFEISKQFTEKMWKEVEFLVTKCRLGAMIVRHILREKLPTHPMFSNNLYAEMQ